MRVFIHRWRIQIILTYCILLPFLIPILQGKVLYWGTVSLQFIPWSSFTIDSVFSGTIPLWNLYNGMGSPFLANYQSAIFYPLNWFLIPFYKFSYIQGLAFGFTILTILHLLIAAIGFSFILKIFKRSESSQLIGSFCWVFGGYIIARISFISMVWAFAWVSWIIFFVLKLKNSEFLDKSRNTNWLAIVFILQLLCGHAQTFAFTVGLSLLILILPFEDNKKSFLKNLIYFIKALLLSLGLAAFQLIPTFEYLLLSQRSNQVGYDYATNFSFWPLRIISLLFPNFWGNPGTDRFFGGGNFWEDQIYHGIFGFIFILILLFISFRSRKSKSSTETKSVFILLLIPIFVFLIALGKNFYLYPLLYKYFPGINLFQGPSRFLIIFSFALCILISFGFDYWNDRKFNVRKIGLLTASSLALLIAAFAGSLASESIPKTIFASIFYTGLLLFVFSVLSIIKSKFSGQFKNQITGLVVFIFFVDLVLMNYPYGQFISREYFPSLHSNIVTNSKSIIYLEKNTETFLKFNRYFRFDRFQVLGEIVEQYPNLIPNTNLISPRFEMVNNFDPFLPNRFAQFLIWMQLLPIDDQQSVLGYFGVNSFISVDPKSINGVKQFTLNAQPKIGWFDCAIISKPENILNEIRNNISTDDENKCVFLEEDLNFEKLDTNTIENKGVIDYISFTNGNIDIKYQSNGPGWIVIRQTWFPGWKAEIDGSSQLKIHKVDYLFQGVYVPKGNHRISLSYKPDSFLLGCLLSLISCGIFVFNLRQIKTKSNK